MTFKDTLSPLGPVKTWVAVAQRWETRTCSWKLLLFMLLEERIMLMGNAPVYIKRLLKIPLSDTLNPAQLQREKSKWKTKISSQTTAARYFSKQVKIINKTLNIVGCLGKTLPQTSELFLLNQAWGTFDCSIKPQHFLVPGKERQEKKLH